MTIRKRSDVEYQARIFRAEAMLDQAHEQVENMLCALTGGAYTVNRYMHVCHNGCASWCLEKQRCHQWSCSWGQIFASGKTQAGAKAALLAVLLDGRPVFPMGGLLDSEWQRDSQRSYDTQEGGEGDSSAQRSAEGGEA